MNMCTVAIHQQIKATRKRVAASNILLANTRTRQGLPNSATVEVVVL